MRKEYREAKRQFLSELHKANREAMAENRRMMNEIYEFEKTVKEGFSPIVERSRRQFAHSFIKNSDFEFSPSKTSPTPTASDASEASDAYESGPPGDLGGDRPKSD